MLDFCGEIMGSAKSLVEDIKQVLNCALNDNEHLIEAAEKVSQTTGKLSENIKSGAAALSSDNQPGKYACYFHFHFYLIR